MESYFVYALRSQKDARIYIGFTTNVAKRLDEHNAGLTKSTKGYRPWILVYCERVADRTSARNREKYLKSGYGKELLKTLINDFPKEALNCSKSFSVVNHKAIVKH